MGRPTTHTPRRGGENPGKLWWAAAGSLPVPDTEALATYIIIKSHSPYLRQDYWVLVSSQPSIASSGCVEAQHCRVGDRHQLARGGGEGDVLRRVWCMVSVGQWAGGWSLLCYGVTGYCDPRHRPPCGDYHLLAPPAAARRPACGTPMNMKTTFFS